MTTEWTTRDGVTVRAGDHLTILYDTDGFDYRLIDDYYWSNPEKRLGCGAHRLYASRQAALKAGDEVRTLEREVRFFRKLSRRSHRRIADEREKIKVWREGLPAKQERLAKLKAELDAGG